MGPLRRRADPRLGVRDHDRLPVSVGGVAAAARRPHRHRVGRSRPERSALESFNPLFPGNSYSGAVGLFGPTNLTDFNPSLTVFPRRGLIVTLESPSYWRTSTADGIYATDLRVLVPPQAGEGKYVGTNPGVAVVWDATRHLQVQGAITRFLPGRFLDATFVSDGFGFYSITARYRF